MDGSESALGPAAQRRHAAMLDRLAARAAARSSSSSAFSDAPAFESVDAFLARFAESKRSIESDIARVRSLPDPKPELDRLSAVVAALERLVAERSYFLPSYDLRASLLSVGQLKDSLQSISAELAPRKKFSFKHKPSRSQNPTISTQESEEITISEPEESKRANLDAPDIIRDSPGFRNKENAILVKKFKTSEEGAGDFTLADLVSCEVYLKGRFRALFIHRLKDCQVFVGPVLGSIHIEEVEGCLFMLASHQIRIHQAKMTDFYLRVRSRPIIEDCNAVRFAPYPLFYQGIDEELSDSGLREETGNWANVDDFKWLRAVQSPNWCILSEEMRVGMRDISDLEENCESS